MRFKSKVVEIDAIQWDGDWRDMQAWAESVSDGNGTGLFFDDRGTSLSVKTLEGVFSVNVGDWVICGTEGEFYSCKDSVFKRKYEPTAELERSGAI